MSEGEDPPNQCRFQTHQMLVQGRVQVLQVQAPALERAQEPSQEEEEAVALQVEAAVVQELALGSALAVVVLEEQLALELVQMSC